MPSDNQEASSAAARVGVARPAQGTKEGAAAQWMPKKPAHAGGRVAPQEELTPGEELGYWVGGGRDRAPHATARRARGRGFGGAALGGGEGGSGRPGEGRLALRLQSMVKASLLLLEKR